MDCVISTNCFCYGILYGHHVWCICPSCYFLDMLLFWCIGYSSKAMQFLAMGMVLKSDRLCALQRLATIWQHWLEGIAVFFSFNFVSLNDMSIFVIWQIWKACVRGQLWEWIWCCLWLIIFTSFPLSRSWTKKPISLFGSFTSDQFLQNLWKLTDYLWFHSSRCVFLCLSANQITKCCSSLLRMDGLLTLMCF